MKQLIVVMCICFGLASLEAFAQSPAPPGAGDKNLSDRNIKDRSMELERIKREAAKPERKNEAQAAADAARFEEVKEDFENIQRLQDEVLTAYRTGKQIEVQKIAGNAEQINKRAIRLESNLFPTTEEKKSSKKSKEVPKEEPPLPPLPQDLKSLIAEQDNTLAKFVANPMFTNPSVANVNDQAIARADLQKLIRLSAALKAEAEKQPK
jgi:TolA-binding protein